MSVMLNLSFSSSITAPGPSLLVPHTLTFCFYRCLWLCLFFICASNIYGTAEKTCAKFTGRTCLVPCSDEFECQGQGHQRQKMKKLLSYPHWVCIVRRAP